MATRRRSSQRMNVDLAPVSSSGPSSLFERLAAPDIARMQVLSRPPWRRHFFFILLAVTVSWDRGPQP